MSVLTNHRDVLVLKGVQEKKSLRAIGRELYVTYETVRLIVEDLVKMGLVKIDPEIVKANNRILTRNGEQELREWRLMR